MNELWDSLPRVVVPVEPYPLWKDTLLGALVIIGTSVAGWGAAYLICYSICKLMGMAI